MVSLFLSLARPDFEDSYGDFLGLDLRLVAEQLQKGEPEVEEVHPRSRTSSVWEAEVLKISSCSIIFKLFPIGSKALSLYSL